MHPEKDLPGRILRSNHSSGVPGTVPGDGLIDSCHTVSIIDRYTDKTVHIFLILLKHCFVLVHSKEI